MKRKEAAAADGFLDWWELDMQKKNSDPAFYIALYWNDMDEHRMIIYIRSDKVRKDRITLLSKLTLDTLDYLNQGIILQGMRAFRTLGAR